MSWLTGRRHALSLPRRFICDLMHAARQMPVITFERRMELSPLIDAREHLTHPPAWAILFAKAFGIVAARRPELRRTYLPFPWPHFWQADESVASIAIERQYEGEPAVFFGLFKAPDKRPLGELAAKLEEWKTKPVDELYTCQRMLFLSRFPRLLRRMAWWYATAWSGKIKGRNYGTFGVSLTGAAGATATNLICPLTTSINCGVIQPDGSVDVRLHFDHRVLDGMPAARALADFEDVLRMEMVDELRAMADTPGPAIATPIGAAVGVR
jgi:hypothetical protein